MSTQLTTLITFVKRRPSFVVVLVLVAACGAALYALNARGEADAQKRAESARRSLIDDGGRRYTNDSFNSTWIVTFPDPVTPRSENRP
jgi:hypothetical protein